MMLQCAPNPRILILAASTVVSLAATIADAQLLLPEDVLGEMLGFPEPFMGFMPVSMALAPTNLRRGRVDDAAPMHLAELLAGPGFGDADPELVGFGTEEGKGDTGVALITGVNPFLDRLSRVLERMFDPFAFLPEQFQDVPNVTLSDSECLVTVDLEGEANQTSIRVYGAPDEIIVEVTKTQTFGQEEPTGAESNNGTEIFGGPRFSLRGAQTVSQFTAVRSFPAPQGCNMTAESSKATVDKEKNQLLIKFPKVLPVATEQESQGHGSENHGKAEPGVVHSETTPTGGQPPAVQLVSDNLSSTSIDGTKEESAIVRSALAADTIHQKSPLVTSSKGELPASGSSWWRSVFGSSAATGPRGNPAVKVQVPMVRYDEF